MRLEGAQGLRLLWQAVRPDLRLRVHQRLDLAQEERLIMRGGLHRLHAQAVAEGLGDDQQPLRAGLGQGRAKGARIIALAHALNGDLVKPGQAGFQGAQRLLQALGKAAAHGHGLAHGFHRRGQHRLGAGIFFKGKTRDLGDHIINAGLEAGRAGAGNVVLQLVQPVAHRQLGGDLGNRKAGRLGGQRRGARHPRVHLDHHHAAIRGVDGELHIGAAGIDADFAQHRNGAIAHDLELLVGQRQRRGDGDGIAGVHAHGVDILDRADDDAIVGAIAHDFHFILFPAQHRFLDQHLRGWRGLKPAHHDLAVFRQVVGDAAAGAAQGERRPDDGRQADVLKGGHGLVQ